MSASIRFLWSIGILLFLTACASGQQSVRGSEPDDRQHRHHMQDEIRVPADAELGAVNFEAACDSAVQPAFDQALAMMHHMMYVQAREQFEDIARQDPECAMARWGVATTLFQPLWGTRPPVEDLERGWALIEEAREIGTDDPREQALIDATAAFFQDPATADYTTRQQNWADAMEEAYRAHADDEDVAALYALSLLSLGQGADDPHPLHEEAEEILRTIHDREPRHPGAAHYMIHTDDIEGRAEKNLDVVEAYAAIAPEVPHALHMPSHIYVRLGHWPEVIEWNERSAEAALQHPAGEYVSLHYPHAQDYIVYARLQRGEDEEARKVMEETFRQEPLEPDSASAFHAAAIPARIAVEGHEWEEAADLEPRQPDHLLWDSPVGMWAESHTWLARGLGAVHTENPDEARQALERIESLQQEATDQGEDLFADYIEMDQLILAGWLAHANGQPDEARRHIEQAADIARRTEKHPLTPGALLPPNEALGNLLLEQDRPEEALEAYQAGDDIWPGRYHTLLGAARAARESGQAPTPYYERLLETAGESQREGVREAQQFLDG